MMNELLVLRDLLAGADVPECVSMVTLDYRGKWRIHVTEDFFRENLKTGKVTPYNNGYDELCCTTKGVDIYCCVEGRQQVAVYDRRRKDDHEAFRREVLEGDIVAKNRRAG